MNRSDRAITVLLTSIIVVFVFCQQAYSTVLTPQQERGRQIYFKGISPRGNPITAYFGLDLIEMPGDRAICQTCHGYDGTGRPESGVLPSNVTWSYLTKSYGRIAPNGSERPPFTDSSLKQYMHTGFYPDDTKGDPSMPIYLMADEDMEDLIAFMKLLGTLQDPGLSDGSVRVGTILPSDSSLQALSDSMRKTLQAFFDDLNQKGGIFGRKIELVVEKVDPGAVPERLKERLSKADLFAMVGSFTPGMDREIAAVIEELETPLIGPFTLFPVDTLSMNRYMFYLYPGLREQLEALARYATKKLPLETRRAMIIAPSGGDFGGVVNAAADMLTADNWEQADRLEFAFGSFDPVSMMAGVKKASANFVMFLGGEAESRALLKEAAKADPPPCLLMTGVMIGKAMNDIPERLKERVFISFSSLPEDRTDRGIGEYSQLMRDHNVTISNPAAQLSAYLAAKVFAEGLRRAGKNLTREKFISSIEGLYDFETGLMPKITYTRNRRIGSLGAYVVTVDPGKTGSKEFIVSKEWISLGE